MFHSAIFLQAEEPKKQPILTEIWFFKRPRYLVADYTWGKIN